MYADFSNSVCKYPCKKNEILLDHTSVTNESFHERRKMIDFKTKTCQDCHFPQCSILLI